jgi:hypothetical protein
MVKKSINIFLIIFLFAKNEVLSISEKNLKKYIKNDELRFLFATAMYGYKLIFIPFLFLLVSEMFNPIYFLGASFINFYFIITSEKKRYKFILTSSLFKTKIKLYIFFKVVPLIAVTLLICYTNFNFIMIIMSVLLIFLPFFDIKIFKKPNEEDEKRIKYFWYVLTVLLLTLVVNYFWILMLLVPFLIEVIVNKKLLNYKLQIFLISVSTIILQMVLYFSLLDLEISQIIFSYIDFQNESIQSVALNTSKLIIPFFLIFKYYIALTNYAIVCSEDVRVYFHRCLKNEIIKFNQKDKLKYYLVDIILLSLIFINMTEFRMFSVINLIFIIVYLIILENIIMRYSVVQGFKLKQVIDESNASEFTLLGLNRLLFISFYIEVLTVLLSVNASTMMKIIFFGLINLSIIISIVILYILVGEYEKNL